MDAIRLEGYPLSVRLTFQGLWPHWDAADILSGE